MPVFSDTAIQISGVRTPSMSRATIDCFIPRCRPHRPHTLAAWARQPPSPRARRAFRRLRVRECPPEPGPPRNRRGAERSPGHPPATSHLDLVAPGVVFPDGLFHGPMGGPAILSIGCLPDPLDLHQVVNR